MRVIPPDPSEGTLAARLRDALLVNGYSAANVEAMITREAEGAYRDGWMNPVRRCTDFGSPLDTLTRLFTLALEVPVDDLDSVPGADSSDWARAGLVAIRRHSARPLVGIRPARVHGADYHFACDARPSGGEPGPFTDFVRGVTPSSTVLAKITLRKSFARALDMGTGDGVQAVLASRHSGEVVATDVNARALGFARFNLAWNGAGNVELRNGDRFEPVEGDAFDLVVSNPPYTIAPSLETLSGESDLPLDTMSATSVRGAAEHLATDGWGFVVCQWALTEDEAWQSRVARWVEGAGCDTWAVQQRVTDSLTHATESLGELGRVDAKAADRRLERWMRYLDREGVLGVGTGFVVLHGRGRGAPWYCAEERGGELTDDAAGAITALFEAKDWLHAHPEPGAVLEARWRLATPVGLDVSSARGEHGWRPRRFLLRLDRGLRADIEVTEEMTELVARCDGRRTLRSVLDEQMQGRGRDADWYAVPVDQAFRKLASGGFVMPVTDASPP